MWRFVRGALNFPVFTFVRPSTFEFRLPTAEWRAFWGAGEPLFILHLLFRFPARVYFFGKSRLVVES